jgi:galactitol-specific phosphotransferase system IIB component
MFSTTVATAGFRAYDNTGVDLGIFSDIVCDDNITCSKLGGRMVLGASTSFSFVNGEFLNNTTNNTVEVGSNDGAMILKVEGFEGFAANIYLSADEGDDGTDTFYIRSTVSNVLQIGNNITTHMSMAGSTGDITGSGSNSISGFVDELVLATATTITASQCGQTFYNSGAIEMELPEASTVLGCKLTFVVMNAAAFHVDPDAADLILNSTNVAGDRILNSTLGSSITITALSASQWAVTSVNGTWTDAN